MNPNPATFDSPLLDDDLALARNAMGQPLHDITKVDIRLLVERPDVARWEKCSTIVLGIVKSPAFQMKVKSTEEGEGRTVTASARH